MDPIPHGIPPNVTSLSQPMAGMHHAHPDRTHPASAGMPTSSPTRPLEPSQSPRDYDLPPPGLIQSFDAIQKTPSAR